MPWKCLWQRPVLNTGNSSSTRQVQTWLLGLSAQNQSSGTSWLLTPLHYSWSAWLFPVSFKIKPARQFPGVQGRSQNAEQMKMPAKVCADLAGPWSKILFSCFSRTHFHTTGLCSYSNLHMLQWHPKAAVRLVASLGEDLDPENLNRLSKRFMFASSVTNFPSRFSVQQHETLLSVLWAHVIGSQPYDLLI